MTKTEALYKFFSSFGLNAYETASVGTGDQAPLFPYLTYDGVTDAYGSEVPIAFSLWYRDWSWVDCNAKADEISAAIGIGGIVLPYDGGAVWVKRGTPFAQSMGDDSDNLIKRKYINLTAEFISSD